MKETTANNKAQHPTQHQRAEPPPTKAKKHNNQQKESIPGGRRHSYAATFMQGSSKPSGNCSRPQNSRHCPPPFLLLKEEKRGNKRWDSNISNKTHNNQHLLPILHVTKSQANKKQQKNAAATHQAKCHFRMASAFSKKQHYDVESMSIFPFFCNFSV